MDAPEERPFPFNRTGRAMLLWGALVLGIGIWLVSMPAQNGVLPAGSQAPSLRFDATSEEEAFDLSEHGDVQVVAFWATWCGACRAEGPVLDRVHRDAAGQGARVIGVSVDNMRLTQVTARARSLGMTYPIAMGDQDDLNRFSVRALPSVFVIDGDGRIADSFVGAVDEQTLFQSIAAARQQP